MSIIRSIARSIKRSYSEEGIYWVFHKSKNTVVGKICNLVDKLVKKKGATEKEKINSFYDVIFINGCDYSVPHPIRYRVDHQMEQLTAAGYSCLKVEAANLNDALLRNARVFIIFRCPISEQVKRFIYEAKKLNKLVLYDIDDLVIDTKYTDTIPYVASMCINDKALYDDGVKRMGETLILCDGVITTTEDLAEELKKYNPNVYINRNNASDAMLKVSQEAVFRRDILPELPLDAIPKHYKKIQEVWKRRNEDNLFVIGYFSGSITHNSDFALVIDDIKRLMDEHEDVRLMIMGELSIPQALSAYADKLIIVPFSSWKQLPFYIAQCDVNIAPLEDTIFNRAKSENKWVEAALVKVPTVASNVGAFKHSIENEITGILINDEHGWYSALNSLYSDEERRKIIGKNSYDFCLKHRVTIYNAKNLRDIIDGQANKNIGFVMPSLNISGGVLVALKHGCILQDAGYDISFIPLNENKEWMEYEGHRFPVLDRLASYGDIERCMFYGWFNKLVATLWDTLDFAMRYDRVIEPIYFVQNFEVDFYEPGNPLRVEASKTYQDIGSVRYITISKWCQEWLFRDYGVKAKFAPNGLDAERFYPVDRNWNDDKIRILIEGDCGSEYKNVDEAFEITNQLDPDKFEIWYMCYTGKTKPFYRIDKNLGRVPQEETADIYRQCHILLKTSLLESFSYPPLEMMSTGGVVVVRPNEGNVEYLVDGCNCLFYDPDDLDSASVAIETIINNKNLRAELIKNGIESARSRDWGNIEEDIISLYSED